jgi:hypothetical protein
VGANFLIAAFREGSQQGVIVLTQSERKAKREQEIT